MGKNIIISGVYKITNEINGKFYIGSSSNIFGRWSGWKSYFKRPKISNNILWDSVQKYGIKNFIFVVVETCEPIKETILSLEQHYINTLRPEYNILKKAGSRMGSKHFPETIAKYKAYWADATKRIEMSEMKKAYYQEHPETAILHSETMKEFYKDNPEVLEKMREIKKDWYKNNPGTAQHVIKNLKKYWSQESNRIEMSVIKKTNYENNPEIALQHSEDLKKYWSNEVNVASQSQRKKDFHTNNPNVAKEHGEKMRLYYEKHPEAREKMREIKKSFHKENPDATEKARIRAKKQFSNPDARNAAREKTVAFYNTPEQIQNRKERYDAIIEQLLNGVTIQKIVANLGYSSGIIYQIRKSLVEDGRIKTNKKGMVERYI